MFAGCSTSSTKRKRVDNVATKILAGWTEKKRKSFMFNTLLVFFCFSHKTCFHGESHKAKTLQKQRKACTDSSQRLFSVQEMQSIILLGATIFPQAANCALTLSISQGKWKDWGGGGEQLSYNKVKAAGTHLLQGLYSNEPTILS